MLNKVKGGLGLERGHGMGYLFLHGHFTKTTEYLL